MECQNHLFQLPDGIHYLNCAYMAPLMRSVEENGIEGLRKKRNPTRIRPVDFFSDADELRIKFGKLVNGPSSQIALMPSVSYGMNSVIRNIPFVKGQHALTISEEFPSCYYTAQRWCLTHGAELRVVVGKEDLPHRGADWNERILEAITPETAFLVMASVHWINGTKFDLYRIGQRCREVGARLIVDGSQSVGALPINLRQLAIDALVCAGYKWLLGPYSTALSYIHEDFNTGIPLEESWMSRPGAEKFESLTDYTQDYKAGAARYDVGQSSNFISVPMLNEALRQLLEWGVAEIQEYCRRLSAPFINFCEQRGIAVDEEAYRAHHLLGIQVPGDIDGGDLIKVLQERRIFVSLRGTHLRISFHLFNHEGDIRKLMEALMQ